MFFTTTANKRNWSAGAIDNRGTTASAKMDVPRMLKGQLKDVVVTLCAEEFQSHVRAKLTGEVLLTKVFLSLGHDHTAESEGVVGIRCF